MAELALVVVDGFLLAELSQALVDVLPVFHLELDVVEILHFVLWLLASTAGYGCDGLASVHPSHQVGEAGPL